MADRRDEVRRQLDQFVPGERVLGGRSRRPSEARYFFEAPDLGVSFAWFGGHGVHVYDRSGKEIDFFSVGDFAKTDATLAEVKRAVEAKVREARGRFVRDDRMPEDISGVAGLGPLERPRTGRGGIRSLEVSKALDMLEDEIADERRAVSRYRELARELEKTGYVVEANLVLAIAENQKRHANTLEGIRAKVRGRP
jgi:bacterioferritin (cytochrome b1)